VGANSLHIKIPSPNHKMWQTHDYCKGLSAAIPKKIHGVFTESLLAVYSTPLWLQLYHEAKHQLCSTSSPFWNSDTSHLRIKVSIQSTAAFWPLEVFFICTLLLNDCSFSYFITVPTAVLYKISNAKTTTLLQREVWFLKSEPGSQEEVTKEVFLQVVSYSAY